MLKNFFKIAYRNLWRSKGFSAINIFGLAIGMAAAMLIFIWIQNELSYDRFHSNRATLYEAWNREVFDEKLNQQMPLPKEEAVAESTNTKPPVFYEVINNEVSIIDAKKDIRQLRLSSYLLDKDFAKQANYSFTANCSENTYSMTSQGQGAKLSGTIGAKDSLAAVAFNRACGNHGAYMKLVNRGGK